MTTSLNVEQARKGWFLAHGCEMSEQFVCVPHQRAAYADDARTSPPDLDGEMADQHVADDHDLHICLDVESALSWSGHQSAKVQAIARKLFSEAIGED